MILKASKQARLMITVILKNIVELSHRDTLKGKIMHNKQIVFAYVYTQYIWLTETCIKYIQFNQYQSPIIISNSVLYHKNSMKISNPYTRTLYNQAQKFYSSQKFPCVFSKWFSFSAHELEYIITFHQMPIKFNKVFACLQQFCISRIKNITHVLPLSSSSKQQSVC